MLAGPRLDPFSARLHAIHQKRRTVNPPPHEEHDAQGLDDEAEAELGERADTDEPALDLEPVEAVDTGCAECGGMEKKYSPWEELRQEFARMKARIIELEDRINDLEEKDDPVYRSR